MKNAFVSVMVAGLIVGVLSGECALSLHGNSYVGLSESSLLFNNNVDRAQYSFEMWFTPGRHVVGEQSLLHTGVAQDALGLWAVEIRFEATIWPQSSLVPAVGVLYVDMWSNNDAKWTKTRYYTVLESFPWVHISFTAASNTVTINNERQRVNKQVPKPSTDLPRSDFALGYKFDGIIDDVRIWSGPKQDSTLCPDSNGPLELYIPFRECSGDIFVGHNYNNTICAMMYGEYDWTESSPVSHPECITQVPSDACSGSKRVMKSSESAPLLLSGAKPSILPIVVIACTIVCAALLLAYYRYRKTSSADANYAKLPIV